MIKHFLTAYPTNKKAEKAAVKLNKIFAKKAYDDFEAAVYAAREEAESLRQNGIEIHITTVHEGAHNENDYYYYADSHDADVVNGWKIRVMKIVVDGEVVGISASNTIPGAIAHYDHNAMDNLTKFEKDGKTHCVEFVDINTDQVILSGDYIAGVSVNLVKNVNY